MAPLLGALGAATVRGFRALGAAFSNFFDNFNRTTSGSLGTSSGGTGEWLATSGTWNANGTVGTSATAASSYPIASVEMGTPNITINLDVDANNGAGAAFWVTDAQNWWGIVPWQATAVSYSQACGTYGQSGAGYVCNAYANNAAYQVCNTFSQTGPAYVCNAYANNAATQVCNAYSTNAATQVCNVYSANATFQVCNASTQNATYGFTCNVQNTNYVSQCNASGLYQGQVCNAYATNAAIQVCNTWSKKYDGFRGTWSAVCNAYGQQAGTSYCSAYGSTAPGYLCNAYGPGVSGYSCGGGVQNVTYGSTCNAYGPGGGTQFCSTYGQQAGTQYCATYGQVAGTQYCATQGGPFYGQACNAYGQVAATQYCATQGGPFYTAVCNAYFTQTNNNPGTRYLRLLKSVANTVTTVLDQSVAATIASIKVIVSAGTITGRAYSAAGQTTQTGTDLTNTPVSPTTGTKHGIILAPGGYTQGSTVDNLSIILP